MLNISINERIFLMHCDSNSNSGCCTDFLLALAVAPFVVGFGYLYYAGCKYEKSKQTVGEVLHIEKESQPRRITTQSRCPHCGQVIFSDKQRSN